MVRHARIITPAVETLGQNIECGAGFYWERQSGGLCRMHALNAYFGGPILDRAKFEAEIREHDARQHARGLAGSIGMSANDVDVTSADQKNILAHILAKHGIFAKMYETRDRPAAIAKVDTYGVMFIHTNDHVWLGRRDDCGRWFKIDSLSGISPMNLSDLEDSRIGVIVPCSRLMDEFIEITNSLNELIGSDVINFLVREMKAGRLIGRIETLVGSAVAILEMQLAGRDEYPIVRELFLWYDQFTSGYTGANCASIKFVLNHVPKMIVRIIQIGRASVKAIG